MTENTETGESGVEPAAPAGADTPAAVEPAAPEPAPRAEKTRFWDRPYVERYLVPLLLPLAVVIGIVVYILNVSRLFLSAPGHVAVVLATVITVTILLGATLLALSKNMRQSSIALLTVGFIALILAAGSVNLGHSQEKKEAAGGTINCSQASKTTLNFDAGPNGALAYAPNSATAVTGFARIKLTDAASVPHTLTFDNSQTQFKELTVSTKGATDTCVAFFPAPGDYTFYCSIPGHRAAGMQGVIHVTGSAMTLAQAQTAAGTGGGASGAGGGASTSTTKAP
jgi:plastocyanin